MHELAVVGSAVLDIVISDGDRDRSIGFGGTCLHAALTAAMSGCAVEFCSPSYHGAVAEYFANFLATAAIEWNAVAPPQSMPICRALVDGSGSLISESFDAGGAYSAVTPDIVRQIVSTPTMIGTDFDQRVLQEVIKQSARTNVASWLLTSASLSAPVVSRLNPRPTFVGLNLDELRIATGQQLSDRDDDSIARVARTLTAPGGAALVTLADRGALLAPASVDWYLAQKIPPASGGRWLGAGDVAFGALAAAVVRGDDLPTALKVAMTTAQSFGHSRIDGVRRYRDAARPERTPEIPDPEMRYYT